jgi:hypothetical protein
MITLPEKISFTGDYPYDLGMETGYESAQEYLDNYSPKTINELILLVERLKNSIDFNNDYFTCDVCHEIQVLIDSLNEIKNG